MRARGFLVGVALLVAPLTGASPAAAQDEEEPVVTPEWVEMNDFIRGLDCPDLAVPGIVPDEAEPREITRYTTRDADGNRVVLPSDDVSRSCRYFDPDGTRVITISVLFSQNAPFSPHGCGAEGSEDRSNEGRFRIDLGQLDGDYAITGAYEVPKASIDAHPGLESVLAGAIDEIAAQVLPRTLICQHEPAAVTCPAITGYTADGPGEPRPSDVFSASCTYSLTEGGGVGDVRVAWASDRSSDDALREVCAAYGDSPVPLVGRIDAGPEAANATWRVSRPAEVEPDPEAFATAARALREQVIGQATTCDGVEIEQVWTPLPAYLADVYGADRMQATPIDWTVPPEQAVAAAAAAASGGDSTAGRDPAGPSEPAADRDWLALGLRIAAIVMLIASLLGLLLAFWMIRREARVRPRLDLARIIIVAAVAVATIVVFGATAPVWAVAAAVGGGAVLGWLQGRNLVVRIDGAKVLATRGAVAIIAFAAGLIATQVAGLLNRAGVITLGVALSLLSAAVTAGLMAGRSPRIREARRAQAAALTVLLLGVAAVAPFSRTEALSAQDEPAPTDTASVVDCTRNAPGLRCPATELLIDMVDWDSVDFNGGLFWFAEKPWAELAIPRGLDEPPEPFSRQIEWTTSTGAALTVDELFTFSLNDEGRCCSVDYDATGTRAFSEDRVEEWVASGPIEDIEPVGDFVSASFTTRAATSGVPFDEGGYFQGESEDACHRSVGGTEGRFYFDDDRTLPVLTKDGEQQDPSDSVRSVVFATDCDLPDFNVDNALAFAEQSAAAARRTSCPSRIDLLPALQSDELRIEAVTTLGPLFTDPHDELCSDGSLSGPIQIGSGARGAMRSQFAFNYNTPETRAAWGDDSALIDVRLPSSIPVEERCETNDAGQAVEIDPEATCGLITMHKVDDQGSWVWVYVDNQSFDGPNVTIRAATPWSTYWYNCHHCSPESPEVERFLGQFHDTSIEWIDGIALGVPVDAIDLNPTTTISATETAAGELGVDAELIDLFVDEDELDPDARAAAAAALVGLLGTAGLLGLGIAESGAGASEVAGAFRSGGRQGIDQLLDERERAARERAEAEAEAARREAEALAEAEATELVSTWDIRANDGEGGFVRVTRAERERLEALDRHQRRADRIAEDTAYMQGLRDAALQAQAAQRERYAQLAAAARSALEHAAELEQTADGSPLWQMMSDFGDAFADQMSGVAHAVLPDALIDFGSDSAQFAQEQLAALAEMSRLRPMLERMGVPTERVEQALGDAASAVGGFLWDVGACGVDTYTGLLSDAVDDSVQLIGRALAPFGRSAERSLSSLGRAGTAAWDNALVPGMRWAGVEIERWDEGVADDAAVLASAVRYGGNVLLDGAQQRATALVQPIGNMASDLGQSGLDLFDWATGNTPPPAPTDFNGLLEAGDEDAVALNALLQASEGRQPTPNELAEMETLTWVINNRRSGGAMEFAQMQDRAAILADAGATATPIVLRGGAMLAGVPPVAMPGVAFAIGTGSNIDQGLPAAVAHGTLDAVTEAFTGRANQSIQQSGVGIFRQGVRIFGVNTSTAIATDAGHQAIQVGWDGVDMWAATGRGLFSGTIATGLDVSMAAAAPTGGAAPDVPAGTSALAPDVDAGLGATPRVDADVPAVSPTAQTLPDTPPVSPTAQTLPDTPPVSPTAQTLPDGAGTSTTVPDGPTNAPGTSTTVPDGPTNAPGTPTTVPDGPITTSGASTTVPDGPAPSGGTSTNVPDGPTTGAAQSQDAPGVAPIRPPQNPNTDLPPGVATSPETQQILDRVMDAPSHGPAGGAGRGSLLQEADADGAVWVNNRRVGTLDGDGVLRNADGQPIALASSLGEGTRATGYVELEPPGLPGQPLHNSRGELLGRVDTSGHLLTPDGAPVLRDGQPVRAAIDHNGRLVEYDGPAIRDVPTEYEAGYGGRRVEHVNPNPTPTAALQDLDVKGRVPVLDEAGAPSHLVEAGPREIQFDGAGDPHFVQRQYPVTARRVPDRGIVVGMDMPDKPLPMPMSENWDVNTTTTPLTGDGAPSPATTLRADAAGRQPAGYAETLWGAVGADSRGVVPGPDGAPLLNIDAFGNFTDLHGNPVTGVQSSNGRVVGYTDAAGARWSTLPDIPDSDFPLPPTQP